MMGAIRRLRQNISDMRRFGPGVLARHTSRRPVAVNVPNIGKVMIRPNDSDMDVVRQTFAWGEYDLTGPKPYNDKIHAKYDAILQAGLRPIIVDAGANIGTAALTFAAQFPKAKIVAIEHDPQNAIMLRENCAGREDIVIVEAAIGAERGFVSLNNDDGLSWAVRTEKADTGVPMITIEDAFERSGGDTPFVVKIDIEGFEKDLFASNLGWISECYAVMIEPHDWMTPGTSKTFRQALDAKPFEMVIRGENLLFIKTP